MYGGLARAMQESNANAYKLFALKNELDQQRRQNAVQDQGLLWAGEDRGIAAQQRTADAAERTRRRGIEDTTMQRQGLVFDQTQADYAAKKAEAEREKAYREAGRRLYMTGKATIPDFGEAEVDPTTGNVIVKRADGGTVEAPADQMFRILGVEMVAKDDGTLGVRRAGEYNSMADELVEGIAQGEEQLAVIDQQLEPLKRKPVKPGWFNKADAAAYSQKVAGLEAKRAALQGKVDAARAKAQEYRTAAETELQRGRSSSKGTLRHTAPGGLLQQSAGEAQAPYYIAEGQGGLLPAQMPQQSVEPVVPPSIDAARALLGQAKQQTRVTVEQQARQATAKAKGSADNRMRRSAEVRSGQTDLERLGGLVDAGSDAVAALGAPMYEAVFGREGKHAAEPVPVAAAAKFLKAYATGALDSIVKQSFTRWWNVINPDRTITDDELDLLIQDTKANDGSIAEALRTWKVQKRTGPRSARPAGLLSVGF